MTEVCLEVHQSHKGNLIDTWSSPSNDKKQTSRFFVFIREFAHLLIAKKEISWLLEVDTSLNYLHIIAAVLQSVSRWRIVESSFTYRFLLFSLFMQSMHAMKTIFSGTHYWNLRLLELLHGVSTIPNVKFINCESSSAYQIHFS